MKSLALLAPLLLPGCSLLFEVEETPASMGADADPSAPDAGLRSIDADPSAPDAATILGTYSIDFELLGVCSTVNFASDRLDIAGSSVIFRSESCPTLADVSVGYHVIDDSSIVVGGLQGIIELWNCAETVRYEVDAFILTFTDGIGTADLFADQIIPPQTNVICAGEFRLHATP